MPLPYSWTERIVTTDAAGALVSDLTAVHTVTWTDADAMTYTASKVATETAIADALGVRPLSDVEKASMDYAAAANKGAQLSIFPTWFDDAKAAADSALDADAKAKADAFAASLGPILNPPLRRQVITAPGQYAKLSNGALISLGPNGEVYQDGDRVKNGDGTASALSKIVVLGLTIWGMGKTNGLWYKRTPSSWILATDFDATSLL